MANGNILNGLLPGEFLARLGAAHQNAAAAVLSLIRAGTFDHSDSTVRALWKDRVDNDLRLEVDTALVKALISAKRIGHAADFVADEAEQLDQSGVPDVAAAVLARFADELCGAGMYGWSWSRYYSAAAVYIARGNVVETRRILERARSKLADRGERPFAAWIDTHIEALAAPGPEVERIGLLQRDFELAQRYNWARSCAEGIRVLERQSVGGGGTKIEASRAPE